MDSLVNVEGHAGEGEAEVGMGAMEQPDERQPGRADANGPSHSAAAAHPAGLRGRGRRGRIRAGEPAWGVASGVRRPCRGSRRRAGPPSWCEPFWQMRQLALTDCCGVPCAQLHSQFGTFLLFRMWSGSRLFCIHFLDPPVIGAADYAY